MAVSTLATIAATGLTTGLSIYQAREQNRSIARAQKSQVGAAAIQQEQLVEQAAINRRRIQNQAQQIEGSLRVAAGNAGVGLGGSFESLARQSAIDEATNLSILNSNLDNEQQKVQSGLQANLDNLSASRQNPLIAGLTGAIGGLQTGLSIASGIESQRQLNNTPSPVLDQRFS